MGIASWHELARTWEAEVNQPQKAVRRFAIVLTDNTLQGNPLTETDILSTLDLDTWGNAHDTWDYLGLRKVTLTERFGDSPYHVEAVAEYSFLATDEVLAPTSRRADWKFEATPGQLPALFYYEGSGNATKRPLTNSAYDAYEGLMTEESLVRVTISKNFWPFPTSRMQLQNFVNSDTYLGCDPGTLKCVGVNSDYTKEFFANLEYQYWATQIVLQYRQSGWALQLPDVGWNYISGGQKRRAMVFDFQNGEWIASPNPVALTNGAINLTGRPDILSRRVNPEAAFTPLLGVPPTTGTWPLGSL